MEEIRKDQGLTNRSLLHRRLDTAGWGLFFIWMGLAFVAHVGWGAGLLGVGILTLGMQAVRKYLDLRVEGFWVIVGFFFLLGGVWKLLNARFDLIPILFITVGVVLFVSTLPGRTGHYIEITRPVEIQSEATGGIMSKYAAYIMISLARILGGLSLLVFMIFLFWGSLNLLDMHLGESGILWFDAGLSLLFFIQHSGMIRKPFRRWLAGFVPEEYAGAIYTIASGIVLLLAILLWQTSSRTVVTLSAPLHWSLRAIFLLCMLGFYWGIKALRFFDPLGLRPIINRLRGRNPKPTPITVEGPYRWVRHPLYFFMILMIWSSPDITNDRLLFNLLWTVWIVIGSYFEEIDLIAEFGDTYREYQKRVPMLVPLLKWEKRQSSIVNKSRE